MGKLGWRYGALGNEGTWGRLGLLGVCLLGGSSVACSAEGEREVLSRNQALARSFEKDGMDASLVDRQGITRARGKSLARGNSPAESAESFAKTRARALGATAKDLKLKKRSKPLGLMFDKQTKSYKYFLYQFDQEHAGLPVRHGRLLTLVRNRGDNPVVWASASTKNMGRFTPPAQVASPGIDRAKLLAALNNHRDLKGRPVGQALRVKRSKNIRPVIFAGAEGAAVSSPRLAHTYEVETESPAGEWNVVVDAAKGDVLEVESRIVFENVLGDVEAFATQGAKAMDCSDAMSRPLPHALVSIAEGNSANTDLDGSFEIEHEGSEVVDVSSNLSGTYFNVIDYTGAETFLSSAVTPPGPWSFVHNENNLDDLARARVNGYVNAQDVRDFLLGYMPDYPLIADQTEFSVYVNRNDAYCPGNAWYNGSSINFCQGSAAYGNTSFGSISYHEYGHHIVASGGSGQGAYGEGMSDVISVLLTGDPGTGYGFFKNDCGSPLRTADNSCQYSATACSSCGSEVHACGNLISGIIWDIREALVVSEPENYVEIINSLVLSSIPMHSGTAIDASIAEDLLILDDDDGNLNNGTPHSQEICAGFEAHGIDCPTPDTGLAVSEQLAEAEGPSGGPFAPSDFEFELSNLGPGDVDYEISVANADWLSVAAPTASLDEGTSTSVQLVIDQELAAQLPTGDHLATVNFSNLTNGDGDTERTVRLRVGVPQSVFFEDFENGLGDFELGTEANSLWRLADDCAAAEGNHSTPQALYFGSEACNFDAGTVAGTARSPIVSLTNTNLVSLELNYLRQGESGTFYDRAEISVSIDGGAFTPIASSHGVGETLNNTGEWTPTELDLSSFFDGSPASLQLQFSFDSRDSVANSFAGFLIDDVRIRSLVEGCTTDSDCQDNLSCNGTESCVEGLCVSSTPVSCDDGVACTFDSCDESEGCEHVPDDASCSDGDVCNGIESCDEISGCSSGTPLTCDDGNACTVDSCDPSTGCATTPVSCDDGNACTVDSCDPSTGCASVPLSCDDGDPCTVDSCDPSGGCSNEPLSCDDSDACTDDVCSEGECTYEENAECGNAGPCGSYCTNPTVFGSSNFQSGNLGSSSTCHETTADLHGMVCGNMAAGRTLSINGNLVSCSGGGVSIPAPENGGYCITTTAGGFDWAYFATW